MSDEKQATWLGQNQCFTLPPLAAGMLWKCEVAAIRPGKVLIVSTPIPDRAEKPLPVDLRKR